MNEKIKTRWVAALRSGDYPQGTGLLRRVDATGTAYHCCLGVLCELAVEAGVVERSESSFDGSRVTSYAGGSFKFPPREVVEWAGVLGDNPVVADADGDARTLVNLNDAEEAPFATIADWIERSL